MRKIRSKDTSPEQTVANHLRSMRFRFIMNDTTLPGKPDFRLIRHKIVVFVHGCFWHRHSCRRGRSQPKTRRAFWMGKLEANRRRDRRTIRELRSQGWHVLILWE